MHDTFNLPYLRAINKARRDEWHGVEEWTSADWSNELCGEVGEAANFVKKLRRIETGAVRINEHNDPVVLVDKLGLELADTIICADLLGMYFDIDLTAFVITKFNRTSIKQGFPHHLLASTNSGYEDMGGSVKPLPE